MDLNRRKLNQHIQSLWLWRTNTRWTWVESALITAITLFLCHLANPHNPLFIRAIFPWPWLAGVLIVLQYGLGPGLLSALIITMVAFIHNPTDTIHFNDIQAYLLSGLTLLITCGLFSSNWLRRTLHAEELLIYTNERFDSLSSSYYMLRISYDYLEHNVITKPYTLRLAMKELQQMSIDHQGQLTPDISYQFLQLLAQHCSINCMGMYLYQQKKLCINPIAELGQIGQLDLNDPLIRQSIDMQSLYYVTLNDLEHVSQCTYLVSIPMLSCNKTCLGFIVIKDMSFWTLTHETLTIISVLISYFIGEITSIHESPELFTAFPDCPTDFAKQLKQLLYLHQHVFLDSAICALLVSKDFRPYNIIEQLKQQRRHPDTTWSLELEHDDVLITLIPFINATGIHGFLTRMTDFLNIKLGITFTDAQIKMRSMQLYPSEPLAFVQHMMDFIGQHPHVD